jgi:peptide subunit release factor 1 (eRF1)
LTNKALTNKALTSKALTSKALTTKTDADDLRGLLAPDTTVISLYLNVPVDIAEHRGLLTRARELIKAADGRPASVDINSVAGLISERAYDWLGRTVAIFACAEVGLLQAIPLGRQTLPGRADDLAVISTRPYTRPLLASLQRHPAFQVAVLDGKHAWILAVRDEEVDMLFERTGPDPPSSAFAGWAGLEAYRMQQRILNMSKQHYRDTAAILEQTTAVGRRPLVLGGHETQINQFLGMLPRTVSQRLVGSFAVDVHSATPGRVRDLANPVIARWTEEAEADLVAEALTEPPDGAITTDLDRCLTAVRSGAVSQLVLADDRMVPGCVCNNCGGLAVGSSPLAAGAAGCTCPESASASTARLVPDVLDELACQALDQGSEVMAVRDAPFTAAARLRFQPAGA